MSKTVLWFGLSMALLLGLLKWVEYRFFSTDLTLEAYLGIIGVLCTGLGAWVGWNLTRPKPRQTHDHPEKESRKADLNPDYSPQNVYGLSQREYEVLELIAEGLSYQEIADKLCVSLSTVKTHASNLFSKLDVQRRTQAVMIAQKHGILPPSKG